MDKYKERREKIKKDFAEGYLDGVKHRVKPDEPITEKGNQASDEGYLRGYADADKAIKEMERKLG